MGRINKKIMYFLTRWYEGSAYKDYQLMKDNFGGTIVEDSHSILKEMKPDLIFCFGDVRKAYKKPLEANIPYILIEQDVYSLRCGLNETTYPHDKEKIENAMAVIFTSEEHAEYYEMLKKKYNWRIPHYEVIYTRPLRKDLTFEPREKLEGLHLVYAGGTVPSWNKRDNWWGYRCYHEIFKQFIRAGWKVHIYSVSNGRNLPEYQSIGCVIHEKIPYGALLQEMSQYTAGLHSYNKIGVPKIAFDYTQTCRPNKLWDYLAAGIPTIGYQGGNGMKIYNGKWGIVIDDLEPETLNKIPERLDKIKISKRMRYSNVIDRDIEKFGKVIDVALKEAVKKDRKSFAIDKNPFMIAKSKNPFERVFPIMVTVENKTPYTIDRLNRGFLPYSTSEVFSVDKDDYRQIRAHVNLRVREIGG